MSHALILPAGANDDFPLAPEIEAGSPKETSEVMVAFGMYPMLDDQATAEAGHEVWKDVEHVKIAIPGDRNMLYFQPAQDTHRKRFPKAYAAFKAGNVQAQDGTPLAQWPLITRGTVMTLKAVHVLTVEMLAQLPDSAFDKLGYEVRALREKAKTWLAERKDAAGSAKMAAEKAALEDRLALMQSQMETLQQRLAGQDIETVPAAVTKARKKA